MTGVVRAAGAPVVFDTGDLLVPGSLTPLVLAAIQDSARRGGGSVHPDLRALVEAAGVAARLHSAHRARLVDLERRAGFAVASGRTPGVLSSAQTGPPSGEEVTTPVVADLLDISPQRVRQLAASGRIAGRRIGRTWWIRKDSAVSWKGRNGDVTAAAGEAGQPPSRGGPAR